MREVWWKVDVWVPRAAPEERGFWRPAVIGRGFRTARQERARQLCAHLRRAGQKARLVRVTEEIVDPDATLS